METIFQKNGISIDRLVTLWRVREAGGIAEAARHDPRKQSLLSRQITELEEATGLKLLDRTSIPHQLTEEGKALESKTRNYVKDLESYLASKSGANETITIAAGESVILWVLIPLLSKFSSKEQGRIRFRNMRSNQAANSVASGVVDLAIHQSEDTHKRCMYYELAEYGLCLVLHDSMETTSFKTWEELSSLDLPIATLEGSGAIRRFVDELCSKHPNAPQIGLECTSYPQILEACKSGRFIGIVPEIANPQFLKKTKTAQDLQYIAIKELSAVRIKMHMSYQAKRSDASELLQKTIDIFKP